MSFMSFWMFYNQGANFENAILKFRIWVPDNSVRSMPGTWWTELLSKTCTWQQISEGCYRLRGRWWFDWSQNLRLSSKRFTPLHGLHHNFALQYYLESRFWTSSILCKVCNANTTIKWQSVKSIDQSKELTFLFISPILKATYRETPVHLEEAPGHLESLYEGFDVLNLFPNKADGPFHLSVEKDYHTRTESYI